MNRKTVNIESSGGDWMVLIQETKKFYSISWK